MDVVLAGLNYTSAGCLLGLSLLAYDGGTLDEEDLILLALTLEIGAARSYFTPPQEIPAQSNLLALDEATFLRRIGFTQRQVEAIHGALALPTDFAAPCRTKEQHGGITINFRV